MKDNEMTNICSLYNETSQTPIRDSRLQVKVAGPVTATPAAVLAGAAIVGVFGLGVWAGYAAA